MDVCLLLSNNPQLSHPLWHSHEVRPLRVSSFHTFTHRSALFRLWGWEKLASTLEPKFVRWVPIAIGIIPVCYVFILFCWYKCVVSVSELSSKHRITTAIGLIPIPCIPIAIKWFICHAPTTIDLAPIRCGMGTHVFLSAPSFMHASMRLLLHWTSWLFECSLCIECEGCGFYTLRDLRFTITLALDLILCETYPVVGFDSLSYSLGHFRDLFWKVSLMGWVWISGRLLLHFHHPARGK